MSDRIEPALNEIERAHALKGDPTADDIVASVRYLNSRLPDSDPRKIRREWLSDLRIAQNEAQDAAWRSCMNGTPGKPCDECQQAVDGFKARLQAISDALASYLPPEP